MQRRGARLGAEASVEAKGKATECERGDKASGEAVDEAMGRGRARGVD